MLTKGKNDKGFYSFFTMKRLLYQVSTRLTVKTKNCQFATFYASGLLSIKADLLVGKDGSTRRTCLD